MRKNCNWMTMAVLTFILLSVFLSFTKAQNITLAGENDSSLFLRDTNKKETPGTVPMYTKIISSLLVLIAIIIAVVFVLRKNYGFKTSIGRGKRYLQVLDHQTLGVKKSIFLVKIPGKHLLLGVTNERVGLIAEVANEDLEVSGERVNKNEFINLIKKSYFEKKQA
ncbi:MAG: flagellar biosynthetic protein FliO [Candidatus Scalindua sp.]|nr:flagellar biosynthetic protein FliO [Candidatus Scalindua sp.]